MRFATCICLVLFAFAVRTDAFESNDDFPKVTIRASSGGDGSLGYSSVRRLIAWRRGDLYIAKYYKTMVYLHVEEILEGSLRDPDFPKRPVGVNNLRVIVINDAGIALEECDRDDREGQWTLSRLPDGTYCVMDPDHTPLGGHDITASKNALSEITDDLKSDDPGRQNSALQRLKEIRYFSCIPLLFPILESKAKVIVPDGMHVMFSDGVCKPFPVESTLGAQARKALVRLTGPLRTRYSPTEKDDEQIWRKWWHDVLNTEPFPEIDPVPGPVTVLAELPMNQSWPEPHLNPEANRAFVGVSRYQYPVDGARSGILLLDIDRPGKPDFVYKVPLDERNCEPTGLATAWTDTHGAMAWKEYFYDEELLRVKFMALNLQHPVGRPVDLGLKRVSHMSLCPIANGDWLLACAAKPEDFDRSKRSQRGRREIFLLILDSSGKVLQRTPPLDLSVMPNFSYHDRIRILSAVSTPKGPALTYVDEDKGAFLLLLDHNLGIRKLVLINDPKIPGHGFMPRLACSGNVLCTAWIQIDNYQNRLFVRQFDIDGESPTEVRQIAEPVAAMTDPVPCDRGFVIAWTDSSQTPNQVRLCSISNNGVPGRGSIVFAGKATAHPIEVGLDNGTIKVMMYDRQLYPYRVLLKEIVLWSVTN